MARKTLIGEPFIQLDTVDSSNNYAMRQVQAHLAEHGTIYFANYQYKGKGQRGKNWNAEPGQNIIMSSVLEPNFISIDNKFVVSCCIALACHDFFRKYAVDNTSIKWPNDIYWKDRKAGGILVENVLQGKDWKYAITGIGININQTLFSADIPNAVSLKQITGKTFDTIALAKELCTHIQKKWEMLINNQSRELLQQYNTSLYKLGENVFLKKDEAIFSAIVKEAKSDGTLIVEIGGNLSVIQHGMVEWIIS